MFIEENGLCVIDCESASAEEWEEQTSKPGFYGKGYVKFRGNDNFNNPPSLGILRYLTVIEKPGKYFIKVRSRKDHTITDQENDSWISVDNGTWTKMFTPGNEASDVGVWSWDTAWEFGHHNFEWNPSVFLDAGEHVIEISGRSHGHKLDRVILQHEDNNDNIDWNMPQSMKNEIIINFRESDGGFIDGYADGLYEAEVFHQPGTGWILEGQPSYMQDAYGQCIAVIDGTENMDTVLVTVEIQSNGKDPTAMPTVRIRVGDELHQNTQMMVIESVDPSFGVPNPWKVYKLVYEKIPEMRGRRLHVAFDWMFVSDEQIGQNPHSGVIIPKLTIEGI